MELNTNKEFSSIHLLKDYQTQVVVTINLVQS